MSNLFDNNKYLHGNDKLVINNRYSRSNDVTLYHGDCLDFLNQIPDCSTQLIITSPPYNIGKSYEKRLNIETYLEQQKSVIEQCHRILSEHGSICWQVGNYVTQGEIIPLDALLFPIFSDLGLKMRNRIVWHFAHGLHCSRRFSGRYETIIWYTKSDDYYFDVDPVRVPQKYPGKKHFKGPRAGKYSGNPKGKNPGDVWEIPNVKSNHVEKTEHPCQFPVELVERIVLSMSKPGDLIFDPFIGVGTSAIAAIKHHRKAAGAELLSDYYKLALERIRLASQGKLKTRPMGKPVHQPSGKESVSQNPFLIPIQDHQ